MASFTRSISVIRTAGWRWAITTIAICPTTELADEFVLFDRFFEPAAVLSIICTGGGALGSGDRMTGQSLDG
jgi:hypothetical protein